MPSVVRGRASGTFFKGYIEGGPAAAKKLEALGKAVRDELLKEATLAGAEVIEDEWRSRAPTGPGVVHYREAIASRARAGKTGATANVGLQKVDETEGEGQPMDYFATLEFGRRDRPAQPSARPAFDAASGKALDAMGAKVVELIEKVT